MNSLQITLAELGSLERPALVERWTYVFDYPPPRSAHIALLRRILAWELQRQASAKWRAAAGSTRLARLLRSASPAPDLSAGTRLLREWQGRTHEVCVLPKGFEYDGKSYRSLSAIARQITGTPWSGPAFFGLRQ